MRTNCHEPRSLFSNPSMRASEEFSICGSYGQHAGTLSHPPPCPPRALANLPDPWCGKWEKNTRLYARSVTPLSADPPGFRRNVHVVSLKLLCRCCYCCSCERGTTRPSLLEDDGATQELTHQQLPCVSVQHYITRDNLNIAGP